MDGRLPSDGGEERVGSVRHQQANQAGFLCAERPSDVTGLKPQTLGCLKDRTFGIYADSALPGLAGQRPGRGRRGNSRRLGDLLEGYRSICHQNLSRQKLQKFACTIDCALA
jgi:hypothetical protein